MAEYEIDTKDISYLQTFIPYPFTWDEEKSCTSLALDDNQLRVTSLAKKSQFKTALGTQPFFPGYRYFFEVKMVKGKNFKIGIARGDCDVNLAFSDTNQGWSYFSTG